MFDMDDDASEITRQATPRLSIPAQSETDLNLLKISTCFQLKSKSVANRFIFHSNLGTLTASSMADLQLNQVSLSEPFWLDILDPTDQELITIGDAFDIHPLTMEDVQTFDTREKCDVFPNYYFVCVKGIVEDEETIVKPVPVSILVMKQCIISIQYHSNEHTLRVLKRFKSQKGKTKMANQSNPDFVCYSLLDEITDAFLPITRFLEHDTESIDDLVSVLKASEQTDMLRRIAISRKRVLVISRLMNSKPELIKLVLNRMKTDSKDILIFLEDIYDHAITMKQDLIQYEKALSRSYSNYLAQISIEITQVSTRGNELAAKMTMIASILLPMTVITGMWGMVL